MNARTVAMLLSALMAEPDGQTDLQRGESLRDGRVPVDCRDRIPGEAVAESLAAADASTLTTAALEAPLAGVARLRIRPGFAAQEDNVLGRLLPSLLARSRERGDLKVTVHGWEDAEALAASMACEGFHFSRQRLDASGEVVHEFYRNLYTPAPAARAENVH